METVLISLIVLVVGLVLREELFKIKRIVQRKEMKDVCDYLNIREVYIRDKNGKCVNFFAHIATHENSNHDCLIIDLDE